MMSKCLCIIPARSGSKRIKNKNIIKINNKPLIYYTINFAKKLSFVDEIIFSSDSIKYINTAKKYGIKNLHLRPKSLSNDNAKTIDVIKYEIKKIEDEKKLKFNLILLLQPTTPFRELSKFYKAYNILKNKNKYDSVITVNKVKNYHPYRMKLIKNNLLQNFVKLKKESFQDIKKLVKVYIRTGSMYFFKKNNLKKNSIIGGKTYGITTDGKYSINIDEYEDLVLAKHFIKKN